jgi:hypothetical protein
MNSFISRGKYMKFVRQVIATNLFIVLSLVLGCQTITEITRDESDKDAAVSKAVKETLLEIRISI